MALRLRYEIDNARRLREHIHFVDGAGYFFFPGASGARGTLATLEIDFTDTDESTALRGWVWARPSGGIWLELADAARALDGLDRMPRAERRLATDQLVLAQAASAVLCRLRDVSLGGARLRVDAGDAGPAGSNVRVALPECGPNGAQLEAAGRIVWVLDGEAGLEWNRTDLASRAAALRLIQLADEEWASARTFTHPSSCRCRKDERPSSVLLLG